jgi:hypothetical protein
MNKKLEKAYAPKGAVVPRSLDSGVKVIEPKASDVPNISTNVTKSNSNVASKKSTTHQAAKIEDPSVKQQELEIARKQKDALNIGDKRSRLNTVTSVDNLKSSDEEDDDKVKKVMDEFKAGKLFTKDGKKVTKRAQALAIALSEAGLKKSYDIKELFKEALIKMKDRDSDKKDSNVESNINDTNIGDFKVKTPISKKIKDKIENNQDVTKGTSINNKRESNQDVKPDRNLNIGSTDDKTTKKPEIGSTDDKTTKKPEIGSTDDKTIKKPEIGSTDDKTIKKPEIGSTDDKTIKKPEIGSTDDKTTTDDKTIKKPEIESTDDKTTTDDKTIKKPEIESTDDKTIKKPEIGSTDDKVKDARKKIASLKNKLNNQVKEYGLNVDDNHIGKEIKHLYQEHFNNLKNNINTKESIKQVFYDKHNNIINKLAKENNIQTINPIGVFLKKISKINKEESDSGIRNQKIKKMFQERDTQIKNIFDANEQNKKIKKLSGSSKGFSPLSPSDKEKIKNQKKFANETIKTINNYDFKNNPNVDSFLKNIKSFFLSDKPVKTDIKMSTKTLEQIKNIENSNLPKDKKQNKIEKIIDKPFKKIKEKEIGAKKEEEKRKKEYIKTAEVLNNSKDVEIPKINIEDIQTNDSLFSKKTNITPIKINKSDTKNIYKEIKNILSNPNEFLKLISGVNSNNLLSAMIGDKDSTGGWNNIDFIKKISSFSPQLASLLNIKKSESGELIFNKHHFSKQEHQKASNTPIKGTLGKTTNKDLNKILSLIFSSEGVNIKNTDAENLQNYIIGKQSKIAGYLNHLGFNIQPKYPSLKQTKNIIRTNYAAETDPGLLSRTGQFNPMVTEAKKEQNKLGILPSKALNDKATLLNTFMSALGGKTKIDQKDIDRQKKQGKLQIKDHYSRISNRAEGLLKQIEKYKMLPEIKEIKKQKIEKWRDRELNKLEKARKSDFVVKIVPLGKFIDKIEKENGKIDYKYNTKNGIGYYNPLTKNWTVDVLAGKRINKGDLKVFGAIPTSQYTSDIGKRLTTKSLNDSIRLGVNKPGGIEKFIKLHEKDGYDSEKVKKIYPKVISELNKTRKSEYYKGLREGSKVAQKYKNFNDMFTNANPKELLQLKKDILKNEDIEIKRFEKLESNSKKLLQNKVLQSALAEYMFDNIKKIKYKKDEAPLKYKSIENFIQERYPTVKDKTQIKRASNLFYNILNDSSFKDTYYETYAEDINHPDDYVKTFKPFIEKKYLPYLNALIVKAERDSFNDKVTKAIDKNLKKKDTAKKKDEETKAKKEAKIAEKDQNKKEAKEAKEERRRKNKEIQKNLKIGKTTKPKATKK